MKERVESLTKVGTRNICPICADIGCCLAPGWLFYLFHSALASLWTIYSMDQLYKESKKHLWKKCGAFFVLDASLVLLLGAIMGLIFEKIITSY